MIESDSRIVVHAVLNDSNSSYVGFFAKDIQFECSKIKMLQLDGSSEIVIGSHIVLLG